MKNDYVIALTQPHDIETVMAIYDHARLYMRQSGNQNQWINGYPQREIILEDIALKRSFLIKKNATVLAVFTFINGDDETYHYIEGAWLNDEKYGVIHRIASAGLTKGMLKVAVEYCFKYVNNLRIDTHQDNKVMQHLLEKDGFVKCGVIYLKDGSPRLAYQKVK